MHGISIERQTDLGNLVYIMTKLRCFVLFVLQFSYILNILATKIVYDPSSVDKYLPGYIFLNNTAYSVFLCMNICDRFKYCKSVNFIRATKQCVLNYMDSSSVATIPMIGSLYMEKQQFPQMFMSPGCSSHSCPLEDLCVSSDKCSQWMYNECGFPTIDVYSITTYPYEKDFGRAMKVCRRAPPGTSGQFLLTCQKDGTWSQPPVPCPTQCLFPPPFRHDQLVTYSYPSGNIVRANLRCSHFGADPAPTPTCWFNSQCVTGEEWSTSRVGLSCSAGDCWTPGTEYNGGISCTHSGKTCQRWDTNYPHRRSFSPANPADRHTNFCRIPGDTKPWCYTTDPNTRWQYCTVQYC